MYVVLGFRFSHITYVCCSIQQRRKTKASYCKILYFYFFKRFKDSYNIVSAFNVDLLSWNMTINETALQVSECAWAIKRISCERQMRRSISWLLKLFSQWFRSLKLLFVMRSYGAQGLISDYIRKQIKLAEIFIKYCQ